MNTMILQSEAVYVDNINDYNWYDNIDMSLGERKRRYLGSGYKKVAYDIGDIFFDSLEKIISASVSVSYPEDWSQKAEGKRKDLHLSTIDILLVSCRIFEVFLACGCGLSATELKLSRIIRIDMDLGRVPTTDLHNLKVRAKYCGAITPEDNELVTSRFEVSIGNANIKIQLEHPSFKNQDPFSKLTPEMIPIALNIANDIKNKYYGDGYISREIDHTDLLVNSKEGSISCFMKISQKDETSELRGMASAVPEAVEVLDLMLSGAQLSQVMIYSTENTDRDNTRNLWMTSFSIYCKERVSGIGSKLPITLKIGSSKIIEAKGKRYRVTSGEFNIIGADEVGGKGRFVLEV